MVVAVIKLIIASLVPVGLSCLLFYLEKKTRVREWSYAKQQIVVGVLFGLVSIMGTEWGIAMRGVVVNCRDAAPIVAGLLFGAPAGIIAGIMGGVERWLAVYWGVGTFTRVACSSATLISGFYAGAIRKYLFDNKRPTWGVALGCGLIMEVVHLVLVLLTNINDPTQAIRVIDLCFVPMVSAVSFSVFASTMAVAVLNHDYLGNPFVKHEKATTPIFTEIQRWLLIVLSVSFVVTTLFIYAMQNHMTYNYAMDTIESDISEIANDIIDASDENMLNTARMVGREITFGRYDIDSLVDRYGLTEVVVVDENGIVTDSNVEEYLGYDMSSGSQSAEFMCLLDGQQELVQAYGPTSKDAHVYRKYAGVALKSGFVQVAYDGDQVQDNISKLFRTVANNRVLGNTGSVVIMDADGDIVSQTKNFNYKVSDEYGEDDFASLTFDDLKKSYKFGSVNVITYRGEKYYFDLEEKEGYCIAAFYPYEEARLSLKVSMYVSLFSILLIFAIMFALIYILIKNKVVKQIVAMTKSLAVITDGNLDEVVNVRSNKEFASLSDDINETVATLKRYIAEAAARIDSELKFAKSIQEAALPEPLHDEHDRFDVYAYMSTAKEVGGDFYDFYLTKNNVLNFLIADVSGKGIPAAMFMMRAKSVLRSLTERGLSVDDVFTAGNDSLCEDNDAGMFVTAWQGSLYLDDGSLYFANAGHNFPLIKHKGGSFEYYQHKANLVLAGMEGVPYRLNESALEPGDIVFLYTDGVTEATSIHKELYGDDRLRDILNAREYSNSKEMCDAVQNDIDTFIEGAPQFDDITMVVLRYKE